MKEAVSRFLDHKKEILKKWIIAVLSCLHVSSVRMMLLVTNFVSPYNTHACCGCHAGTTHTPGLQYHPVSTKRQVHLIGCGSLHLAPHTCLDEHGWSTASIYTDVANVSGIIIFIIFNRMYNLFSLNYVC